MITITTKQKESLEQSIYDCIMGITMYSSEGEEIEIGMDEMGYCREQANTVVSEWMEKEGVEEVNEPTQSNIDTVRSILTDWNKCKGSEGKYTNILDLLK